MARFGSDTFCEKLAGVLKKAIGTVGVVCVIVASASVAYGTSAPDLGEAGKFGVLSKTYVNTSEDTVVNGGYLGYTTGPAITPKLDVPAFTASSSEYSAAGTDQQAALDSLNRQPCTHTFPAGAVDLATDTSHGQTGLYPPGVYCMADSSPATLGGNITLSGQGTYIFRLGGALTTAPGSVALAEFPPDDYSVPSSDVYWTPTGATSLGPNSTFIGTVIDDSGITVGDNVNWSGKALAAGGTVTTGQSVKIIFAGRSPLKGSGPAARLADPSIASFIAVPLLVAIALFGYFAFLLKRKRLRNNRLLAAALAWLVYAGYETVEWLVFFDPDGGAPIRIDLFLIWPALLAITIYGLWPRRSKSTKK